MWSSKCFQQGLGSIHTLDRPKSLPMANNLHFFSDEEKSFIKFATGPWGLLLQVG